MKSSDHWYETLWTLDKSESDHFTLILDQMGSLGSFEKLALDLAEEDLKTTTTLAAYFPDAPSKEWLQNKLNPLQKNNLTLLSIERIPYGDWATAWKEFFHPFSLTEDIVICPSWEAYTPKAHEKVITLDPGMAFGTGQHDTTQFCSQILCDLTRKNVSLNSVLDVGCGSGILSFIAAKLGAESVLGIDNDPAAIETALENLEKNPDLKTVCFAETNGTLCDAVTKTHDVVLANIIAEALCELKPELLKCVKPSGYLILSGILPERSGEVQAAYADLKLMDQKVSPHWHALLYQKPL